MNTTPYIVGYKNSDQSVVCGDRLQAEGYISDLISEGEDEDNIVVYSAQMVTANISVERSAKVTIGKVSK
jgi:hypothetical protein